VLHRTNADATLVVLFTKLHAHGSPKGKFGLGYRLIVTTSEAHFA